MLPYQQAMIEKLSTLQREFIIDHVDGMRPFVDHPIENATRKALLFRELIRYEPPRASKPTATVLTDDGREALGFILGDMADNLVRAIDAEQLSERDEIALLRALTNVHRCKEELLLAALTRSGAAQTQYEQHQIELMETKPDGEGNEKTS